MKLRLFSLVLLTLAGCQDEAEIAQRRMSAAAQIAGFTASRFFDPKAYSAGKVLIPERGEQIQFVFQPSGATAKSPDAFVVTEPSKCRFKFEWLNRSPSMTREIDFANLNLANGISYSSETRSIGIEVKVKGKQGAYKENGNAFDDLKAPSLEKDGASYLMARLSEFRSYCPGSG